ncbi:MAG TPA: hypothetical protein VLH40_03425 [Atribacteraceae bacterium]|nr:hypothetical protein [Atribacteraceae bacterium]
MSGSPALVPLVQIPGVSRVSMWTRIHEEITCTGPKVAIGELIGRNKSAQKSRNPIQELIGKAAL